LLGTLADGPPLSNELLPIRGQIFFFFQKNHRIIKPLKLEGTHRSNSLLLTGLPKTKPCDITDQELTQNNGSVSGSPKHCKLEVEHGFNHFNAHWQPLKDRTDVSMLSAPQPPFPRVQKGRPAFQSPTHRFASSVLQQDAGQEITARGSRCRWA